MAKAQELQTAVDKLEVIHTTLGDIVRDAKTTWRADLVQARRALSEAMGEVIERLNHEEALTKLSDVDRSGVRERLTNFRSALAMHQATFPAVAISNADDPVFRSSRETVRATAAALFTYVRGL